jgi:alkylation response protein AidB-like acyl-CoA dehydrogenase
VGIAEGAIMDLVELAGAGVKQLFMTTPLVETERFKEGLARLDADLMAARALLEAQITRVWQNPERAAAKDMARVAEQLQATAWITSACVRVAEGCFELAGSRAASRESIISAQTSALIEGLAAASNTGPTRAPTQINIISIAAMHTPVPRWVKTGGYGTVHDRSGHTH